MSLPGLFSRQDGIGGIGDRVMEAEQYHISAPEYMSMLRVERGRESDAEVESLGSIPASVATLLIRVVGHLMRGVEHVESLEARDCSQFPT